VRRPHTTPHQQPLDPARDRREQRVERLALGRRRGVKHQRPGRVLREHAVEDEGVGMYVHVQR
jgi:hypothetical protein